MYIVRDGWFSGTIHNNNFQLMPNASWFPDKTHTCVLHRLLLVHVGDG